MDYKTIRFQSKPITLRRRYESYLPNSRYWNELSSLCYTFQELKEFNDLHKVHDPDNFKEKIIESINIPQILVNCQLNNFPFRIGSGKYIETDKIIPTGEKNGRKIIAQYYLISKKYILLDKTFNGNSEYLKIIEFKRLDALRKNQRVKIYDIEVKNSQLEIITVKE